MVETLTETSSPALFSPRFNELTDSKEAGSDVGVVQEDGQVESMTWESRRPEQEKMIRSNHNHQIR